MENSFKSYVKILFDEEVGQVDWPCKIENLISYQWGYSKSQSQIHFSSSKLHQTVSVLLCIVCFAFGMNTFVMFCTPGVLKFVLFWLIRSFPTHPQLPISSSCLIHFEARNMHWLFLGHVRRPYPVSTFCYTLEFHCSYSSSHCLSLIYFSFCQSRASSSFPRKHRCLLI